MTPGSPHGMPILMTADEKGNMVTFSHEHPNGQVHGREQVLTSGMSIGEYAAPVLGGFAFIAPGISQDLRLAKHEVWTKETWLAMRHAGVETSVPPADGPQEVYIPASGWVPVPRPAAGEAVQEMLDLFPGGFLKSKILQHSPYGDPGTLRVGLLPKSPGQDPAASGLVSP